jgi:hypothetical protein
MGPTTTVSQMSTRTTSCTGRRLVADTFAGVGWGGLVDDPPHSGNTEQLATAARSMVNVSEIVWPGRIM